MGLKGQKPSRSVPEGVIPFRAGIILNQRAHIEAPLHSVLPAAIWPKLALVLSVRSHRVNSAFLFTLLSSNKKLLLGLQLVPGSLVLHTGLNTSVTLPYEPHDGQWHQLALEINGKTVTLYASCGEQSVQADFGWDSEEGLAPELQGSFLLGKSSQHQATGYFEGAICQFDLVPSAQAAHNYCKYIKKQCREADTYRPNLSPLLPILPRVTNISAIPAAPKRGGSDTTRKATKLSLARNVAAAASAVRYVAPTHTKKLNQTTTPTPLLVTVMPTTSQLGLVVPSSITKTETVTAPLRTPAPHAKSPTPNLKSSDYKTAKPTPPPKPTHQSNSKETITKETITRTVKKKFTTPATKSPKTKIDTVLQDQARVLNQPQPTTPKKILPKSKVSPSKAPLPNSKSDYVKDTPSKPTLSKAKSSKSTVPKTTTAKPLKPISKQTTKPTKKLKTTKVSVTPRPTKPTDHTVTPPATDGFLSWEVPPTQFSMLTGPKGEKGDPGPPVRTSVHP